MTTPSSKIISIAPTFSCSKKCEGCYLTTGVTKEMRKAELKQEHWIALLSHARRISNYNELAISWNPMNSVERDAEMYELAREAMRMGYDTINITTTTDNPFPAMINSLAEAGVGTDLVLSLSCDDIHGFDSLGDFLVAYHNHLYSAGELRVPAFTRDINWGTSERTRIDFARNATLNLNLLWTPGVFNWLFSDPEGFKEDIELAKGTFDTIQHLMLKPLSLYGEWEDFIQMYTRVFTEHPEICIAGNYGTDGKSGNIIGDATLNSLFNVGPCAATETELLDIDPMGNVRICPENPDVIVQGSLIRETFDKAANLNPPEDIGAMEGLWRHILGQRLRFTHTGTYEQGAVDPMANCATCTECNCITGAARTELMKIDFKAPSSTTSLTRTSSLRK